MYAKKVLSKVLQPSCKRPRRSSNHKYKSNNWLKMHKEPMRRKPYKKEFYPIIDEMHLLFNNSSK